MTRKVIQREAQFTRSAIRMIELSTEPVSTKQLVAALKLNRNAACTLRRGLRRAKERQQIERVSDGPDGSSMWVAWGHDEKNKETRIFTGAAIAAAIFIGKHLDDNVNIEEAAKALNGAVKKTDDNEHENN